MVYVGNTTGMGCSYDDEVGKKLFEVSPSEVPSEEKFPILPILSKPRRERGPDRTKKLIRIRPGSLVTVRGSPLSV